jgi:hypothetical protein
VTEPRDVHRSDRPAKTAAENCNSFHDPLPLVGALRTLRRCFLWTFIGGSMAGRNAIDRALICTGVESYIVASQLSQRTSLIKISGDIQ